jgi:hypothetical protein
LLAVAHTIGVPSTVWPTAPTGEQNDPAVTTRTAAVVGVAGGGGGGTGVGAAAGGAAGLVAGTGTGGGAGAGVGAAEAGDGAGGAGVVDAIDAAVVGATDAAGTEVAPPPALE